MAERSEVAITLKLETAVRQDGDQWIAWCVPLDLLTQAESRAAAQVALREAIDLWFESCLDRGVLEEALMESGFYRSSKDAGELPAGSTVRGTRLTDVIPSTPSALEYIEVTIPAFLAAPHPELYASR